MEENKRGTMIRIHASQFYNYLHCPAKVYLNIYGDKSKRLLMSEFMQKKATDGILHEKSVLEGKEYVEVKEDTDEKASRKTLELMKQGVDLIYQGVLIHEDMIGRPDLIEKKKGKSVLGDYHYIASDIKSGKHLKAEYRIQVTFYAYMLELIQGRLPSVGKIINSEKKELDFKIGDEIDRFYDVMREIRAICKGNKVEPSVSSKCAECVWRQYCYGEAEKRQDISLVYRLSSMHKDKLNKAGILVLKDILDMDMQKVSEKTGIGESTLSKFRIQAQALVDNKVVVLHKPRIETAETEIFFDIEGETELGIDYLYGLLVVKDGKAEYIPFWADTALDEEKMWTDFCKFMSTIERFKMYYYTQYETLSINRLKGKYGMDKTLEEKMQNNMVDLFKIVSGHVVMPLYSYSIKPIAKYLGFSWADERAGGAQSMIWYGEWLARRDEKIKDIILEYNKNDCEATRVVLDWLRTL